MASHGFEVTKHYKDMSTAWRAAFTHKSSIYSTRTVRTLGVNSEMDALPGIGHACGHNLIAVSGVGVALAVKVALEKHDVSGNVVLLGTPAEEGGQGKATLIERGAYKEMDACVMCVTVLGRAMLALTDQGNGRCHPGPGPKQTAALGSSLAIQGIEVEFFGHTYVRVVHDLNTLII
jgi:metal-dependent amidase/aminoacylase/carboxypeptidase family protein